MKAEKILENKGKEVYSVHVDAIVSEALQVMSDKNVGALMVLDGQRNVKGIVSERDVMRSGYRSQANVKGLAVKEVMTPREKLIVARAAPVIMLVAPGPIEEVQTKVFRRLLALA